MAIGGFDSSFVDGGRENEFLARLWATLKRNWLFIISCGFLMFSVLVVGLQLWPKTYRATATVQVQSPVARAVRTDLFSGEQNFTDETAGTELGILRSRDLRLAVINKLHLLDNPEFNPTLKPSTVDRVLTWAGDTPLRLIPEDWLAWAATKVPESWVSSNANAPSPGLNNHEKQISDTLDRFAALVTEEPIPHSKIIEVLVSSRDRVLAATVANTVVQEYIAMHVRMKDDLLRSANSQVDKQMPALQAAVDAANAKVEDYRQKNTLVSGQVGPIMREQLTEATKSLGDARNRLSSLEASQAAAARPGVNPLSVPEVLASPSIQALRKEEATAAEETGYAAAYMRERVGQKSAAVSARIAQEARRIVASLPQSVFAARQNVASLEKFVNALQVKVAANERLNSQLADLKAEADAARAQLMDFQRGRLETRPDTAYAAVNVSVISPAGVPYRPATPNMKIMVPASFALSFLLMCGIALLRDGDGLRSSLAISQLFDVPVIGRVPDFGTGKKERLRYVYETAIEDLMSKVVPPHEDASRKTILITSPNPHDGKTTIAKALGISAAARGISVIVVDADMRRGNNAVGSPITGLGDVLSGNTASQDVTTTRDGVALIPAGTPRANPGRLLAMPSLRPLLAQLQEQYELVIIDTPPIGAGGDAVTLSHFVNEVLVIVTHGTTRPAEIRMVLNRLPTTNAQVVMNKMPVGVTDNGEDTDFSRKMISYYQAPRPKRLAYTKS